MVKKLKGAHISIAIVCLILGIMLAVQFRTQEQSPLNLSAARWSELTVQLDTLKSERDALAEEVASLRSKLGKGSGAAAQAINEEMLKVNMAAGLIPVKGQGLVITLNDSSRPLSNGDDPNYNLIHDQDLLMVVNELKAAGAEAISINGQRLVANSEIRCAGPTILVNGTKIAPPFVIKAIGDPDVIQSSLLITGGYIKYLEQFGVQVQIQKATLVQIPAYKGSIKFDYAKSDNG